MLRFGCDDYSTWMKLAGTEKLNSSTVRRRVRIAAPRLAKLQRPTFYLRDVQTDWDSRRSKVIRRLREFPAIIAGDLANFRLAAEVAG
jgi:hypothetical protein